MTEVKTMTAEEARVLTEKNPTNERLLKEVLNTIRDSANAGNYECWFYKSINNNVRDKLVSLGYDVGKTTFERDESLTKISWKP